MSRPPGSFSFPPPPPPPPKLNNQGVDSFNPAARGRGFSHDPNRSRGHGHGRGRGRGGGGGGGGGGMSHGSNLPRSSFYGGAPSQNRNANATQQAHKRNFGTAFGGAQPQSRPQAPPAVPSFSAGLDSVLHLKPGVQSTARQANAASSPPPTKKTNILGLTPHQDDGPESEDDGDEEAKLATPGGLSSAAGGIQFEYKGNVSTLSTPADIAAWIAERRKRYPTQAKREAAQKEAEERKEEIQKERQARQEEARREKRERERKERTVAADEGAAAEKKNKKGERKKNKNNKKEKTEETAATASNPDKDMQNQARLRAEKLRRKLEKAERALAAAMDESSKADDSQSAVDVKSSTIASDSDTTMSSSLSEEETSSSGSDSDSGFSSDPDGGSDSDGDSDSDSDGAPEELSSKIQPEDVAAELSRTAAAAAAAATAAAGGGTRVCSFFAKGNRRCKYGDKCRFSHVRPETETQTETQTEQPKRTTTARAAKPARPAGGLAKRKGLWDVLVEKELEEENKKVLQAIIALGDAGMLAEDR